MYSLLSESGEAIQASSNRQLFSDLNIDQIIKRITTEWGEDISEMFFALSSCKEDEDYRRGIFCDFKRREVAQLFLDFLGKMRQRTTCAENRDKVTDETQKQAWYISEIGTYIDAVDTLLTNLSALSPESSGLGKLISYLKDYTSSKKYTDIKEGCVNLKEGLSKIHFVLTYENERITLTSGKREGKYTARLNELFPNNGKSVKSPFQGSLYASDLEQEILDIVFKENKSLFSEVNKFCKNNPEYLNEDILRLEKEIPYYLSYIAFMNKEGRLGASFCTPKPSDGRISATGLYDLALFCMYSEDGKKVVSNDMDMFENESFFVLTGPNQGGKTTFARSLGQMIYFSKMGLDVPAKEALVPYYSELLTHFSTEESLEPGRGKLVDELMRLKPMLNENGTGAFVVINELFTTAANYDACIMGKKVISHFIRLKCKGIYVTHICELADSDDEVVSLRATLNDKNEQTFVIERHEPEEIARANIQVEKYGLTYEKIMERLS